MINIGFIGGGFMNQQCHIPAFSEIPEVKIVALAEIDATLRQKVAAKYGIPNIYPTHKEIINDESIDAVVIAVKRCHTFGLVKDCLEAGKHVQTEKPLCLSVDNAELVVRLARERGLILNVGYMKRHDKGVKEFAAYIKKEISKNIPKIISFHHYGGDSYWNPISQIRPEKLAKKDENYKEDFPENLKRAYLDAYELFLNCYSHCFDLMEHISGGVLSNPVPMIDEKGYGITTFQLKIPNGNRFIPTSFHSMDCGTSSWEERMEIVFNEKITRISLPPPLLRNVPARWAIKYGNAPQREEIIQAAPSWAFLEQAKFFAKAVLSQDLKVDDAALRQVLLVRKIFDFVSR
jgi:predicted dehydrogenase